MANIIGVGIATVDIVNVTDGFPAEDEEVRALDQSIRRGGNVTNSLVVLSQLGHQCTWLGTLADDINSEIITIDLARNKVDFTHCQRIENTRTPTSYITLNRNNGSRTIVHYRDLPELSQFAINGFLLANTHWLHFEARNIENTRQMLDTAKIKAPHIPVSIEVEKPREQLDLLYSGADVYFFSKAFALTQGFESAETLLHHFQGIIPDALLVCTWGKDGAYALHDNQLAHAHAVEVRQVIDSIGAGDTFNAGFIHSWLMKHDIQMALEYACALAAKKISQDGFNGLQ